ncbi:MAG: hypothetical protein M1833_001497 [Piccolia ochrophora]|nr:MAG: hypothetical protein M1833_001497 [Piccolia ochrophora]
MHSLSWSLFPASFFLILCGIDAARNSLYRHNISCFGDVPRFVKETDFPTIPGFEAFDPREYTVQELCVRHEYGGNPPGQNVGGWSFGDDSSNTPMAQYGIVFDKPHPPRAAIALENPRLQYFCKLHCVGWRRQGPRPQPWEREDPRLQEHTPAPLDSSNILPRFYEITVDRFEDYTDPPGHYHDMDPRRSVVTPGRSLLYMDFEMGRYADTDSSSDSSDEDAAGDNDAAFDDEATIHSESEWESEPGDFYGLAARRPHGHALALTLNPENRIECANQPHPFLERSGSTGPAYNLRSICPTYLGGGGITSAGGYCHRSADGTREVWFSDDLTSSYHLTWASHATSIPVRLGCWMQCRCVGQDPRPRRPSELWMFLPLYGAMSSGDEVDIVRVAGAYDRLSRHGSRWRDAHGAAEDVVESLPLPVALGDAFASQSLSRRTEHAVGAEHFVGNVWSGRGRTSGNRNVERELGSASRAHVNTWPTGSLGSLPVIPPWY